MSGCNDLFWHQMMKKKKGAEGEGDDDREQSRTPIRSELDKLEGSGMLPLIHFY